MTHQHVLIIAGDQVDGDSQFFRVTIGTSKQATSDYLYLVSFAANHGYYFERRTGEVGVFLEKLATSLCLKPYELPFVAVTARDLVRTLKKGDVLPQHGRTNLPHLLHFLSLNYRSAFPSAKHPTSKT